MNFSFNELFKTLAKSFLKPVDTNKEVKNFVVKIRRVKPNIIEREKWPQWMRSIQELKGASIGCIYGFEWDGSHTAHAHCGRKEKYSGWVCFKDEKAWNRDLVRKHEAAHILNGPKKRGHGKKWAEQFIKLGLPKRYTLEYFSKKYGFKL